MIPIALVVGGGGEVWPELEEAKKLCLEASVSYEVLFCNDMIEFYPDPGIAVTLHPDKLGGWLSRRRAKGFVPPKHVVCHRPHKFAHKTTKDWGGSVGLFATKVAMEAAFRHILLCGVPMEPQAKHFVRNQPWVASHAFRRAWENHWKEIKPITRSMSGWTASHLGKPTIAWVQSAK